MLKLVKDIIEILGSENGVLSEALVKTKILLHQIGHKDLVPWVNSELTGYADLDSLPDYRVIPAQVLVNATNNVYQVTAHPIPLGHLTDEQRKDVETVKMNQSLAVLEQFVRKDEGHLQGLIPMESYGYLGQGLDNSYQIQRAWSEISKTNITQILIQVRSRLLDFMLELQDQLPDDLSDVQVRDRISTLDTENMFNNAIFGDNTTILVGSDNKQSVINVSLKGNFDLLAEHLEKNGVAASDISELRDAIDADGAQVDHEAREYGPAVKSWLSTMLSKAVNSVWQVKLGVASSLLASALNSFYGWF